MAAVFAVPVEISLFLPFAKMHKHIHSLTGDFENSQKSDYTISGKAKYFVGLKLKHAPDT